MQRFEFGVDRGKKIRIDRAKSSASDLGLRPPRSQIEV
jgi:hypothetical protein